MRRSIYVYRQYSGGGGDDSRTLDQRARERLAYYTSSDSENEGTDVESVEEVVQQEVVPPPPRVPRTVQQMLEDDDEAALFNKMKEDFNVGDNIRIHWTDQEDVELEDQEIFNARIAGWQNKRMRGGARKRWVNIKYVDYHGWSESIGRRANQPYSDFWRRLVRDEE